MIINDSDPIDVGDLTDYDFSWILLMRVLRGHDPAGVSLGRSRRNVLLSAIIASIPKPDINLDELDGHLGDVLKEARLRLKYFQSQAFPKQMLLPFSLIPEYLDDEILAKLLLVHLYLWYKEDERIYGYDIFVETSLVYPAIALIGLVESIDLDSALWQLTADDILKEVRERKLRKLNTENNFDYWFRK